MGCVIELESVTNAIKARDLLKKNKFRVTVEKSTGKSKKGCAYSVNVNGSCDTAEKLIDEAGIRILGIS